MSQPVLPIGKHNKTEPLQMNFFGRLFGTRDGKASRIPRKRPLLFERLSVPSELPFSSLENRHERRLALAKSNARECNIGTEDCMAQAASEALRLPRNPQEPPKVCRRKEAKSVADP